MDNGGSNRNAYYQLPDSSSEAKAHQDREKELQTSLKSAGNTLDGLERAYREKEASLSQLKNYLDHIAQQYKVGPTEQLAERYERVYGQYAALSQEAKNAYYDYLRGADSYEQVASQYSSAQKAYKSFMSEQRKQHDAWKRTIRDYKTVQADLDAIDAQIKALDKEEKQSQPIVGQVLEFFGANTRGKSDAMKELEAKKALLQEEYDWSRYYQYADLQDAEDFALKSQYATTANGSSRTPYEISADLYPDASSGFDWTLYDAINGNEDARAYLRLQGSSYYGPESGGIGAMLGSASEGQTQARYMTADEVAVFNYLYATQGKEVAQEYYDYLRSDLNYRQRQESEAYWKEYARESPGAASVFSLALSPLKGLSYVGQIGDLVEDGKLEENADYNKFSYVSSTIRNEVAQKIQESGKWGKVGSFAYQTGMSMADFLLNTALSGGNRALALTIMGSGAAADTTLSAKDRGLSDGQAFTLGTIAGLAEALTEKYSLEALLDTTSLGKSAAGYIAKNMLAEGSEEGASSLINLFADILISRDKSEWSQSVAAYRAQGMSESEAFGRAFGDQAASIGLDMLGGALSGGIMAGGGVAINKAGNAVSRVQQAQQEKKADAAAAETFQEDIQKQVSENMAGTNGTQTGSVRLADMQVDAPQALWQQAQRLASAMNRNIVLFAGDANVNGYFDVKTGEIYVNINSEDPLAQIFSHELTHSVESARVYQDLSNVVLQRIAQTGQDLDQVRQAKADAYSRSGVQLRTQQQIDAEIVAEYVQKHLLTDEGSIVSLTQQNRSLSQRILSWLDGLLAKLGNKGAQERAFVARARELYAKALQQTQSSFAQETAGTAAPMGDSGAEKAQVDVPAPENAHADDGLDWVNDPIGSLDTLYASGAIADDEYNAMREAFEQDSAAGRQYSISEIEGQKEHYGQGVILDTDIFDGVRPRAWGDVLSAYVYNNLAGTELTVYDENGNGETIYLAKANDRVRKDGAKNSHKVLDKLAGYRGDGVRSKAIVQISEVLAASKHENTTDEHTHQWLDENGWILRKAYLQTRGGDIYEATLNIADGRERKILYDISRVHWIDKKETSASIPSTDNGQRSRYQEPGMGGAQSEVYSDSVANADPKVKGNIREASAGENIVNNVKQTNKRAARGDVPSAVSGRGSLTKSNSSGQGVTDNPGAVKRKYSISEDAVSKKDVAGDLRAILKRGGSASELRQYVAQLERSGAKAEQKAASAEQTGGEAEQILKNAKGQGIGVEEYLRRNWERYDQDGQWNADARKALELEKKAGRKYSISDPAEQAYLEAVNRGDMEAAQKMVDEAAKAAGYDSPLLYHGTKSFGFTEFDLSKMDDKRSIFLTDNERIAATYSGIMGKRDASGHTLKDVESLSFQELVEELNSEQFGTAADPDDKFIYEYYDLRDINALISSVNTEIDSLKTEVPQMIRQYADRMATDFSGKDHRTHEQLVKLDRLLQGYSYSDISTQLYMLLHYTDAFNTTAEGAARIAELEKNVRLMNKLIVSGDPEGVIVESWLGGYTLNVLNKQQAGERLGAKRKTGNYGLYAKLGNSLVIDAKGTVWNDIRHWSDAIGYNLDNTEVERQGEIFALINKKTGEAISEGSIAVNPYTENMPSRQRHTFMLHKAQDSLAIITESMNNTREIAAFAQKRGYDSVVFQNLRDNGGNNAFVGTDEQAGIYVLFDPSQAKSADPVAYDDAGNVIPLSERFDAGRKDIRYSISEDGGAEREGENGQEDIRTAMPRKALEYLKRTERSLLWKIGDALSVPKLARREYLVPIIQELSDEYLRSGTIAQEKLDLLFEKAYAEGVIVDTEFYDQYKHIKDHLRTVSVTISQRDQADIADFKNFKRRAFGTLRIVNEGGLPVDSAYHELQELAPELFPESITHPADQLQRMFDAARSIQVTEKTVQDYYGKYEPEYRKGAKLDFEAAVGEVLGDLQTVKRYADERRAKENQKAPATAQEAMAAYKELKTVRRNYERVSAKNLLTAHDEMQVGRLLRHEMELEHLDPKKDNVKGITAVYEAKAEYDQLCKLIGEYKQHLRGQLRKKADKYLETANTWKDKKVGALYSRETMRRNIQDIVPDKELARQINEEFFEPVHRSEAESNRFRTKYRDRVRGLLLSTKVAKGNLVSEAHAVQLLGEAEDNIRMLENMRGRIKTRDGKTSQEWQAVIDKLWQENPNMDDGKIRNAVNTFRKIYDELFQQMNTVRVANGYEPVNYRNGYFPHFQPGDSDSILVQFGKMLGIDTQVDALPTTINGLTHTFKPGIQWFGNAQERLGFNTAYDAVEGFDKYIEGVASVIYHTENIQKLRALATQIRYRTSEKGIQEQVDAIYADNRYSEDEKQVMINEIYSHGKFALSNFVTELDEYTNLLANKKSKYDRTIEAIMGRRAYTIMKAWEARVGANMIAGNLTSALTNFIPLTQAGAQMDRFSLLKGMWATLQAYRIDDGIVGMSSFLTNRRGSDPLVKTWAQKASGVLGKPMELIDNFTADSIVRGAYLQNLKRGLSEAEAMNQADIFAANVMADRSKGSMPTMMQASNPLFKVFTQFQLEVNNQFSEVFKDLPRGYKEKGLKALAWVLLKYFLGAMLYNELYEKLIGRRPALDPIGILCDAVQDTVNLGVGQAGANMAVNVLEQLPFSAGLSLVGIEIDGGRIPASAAVPDLSAIWDAATTEGWSTEKRWKEVQDELNKLAYVVPPFGGNQASKIWKGVKAYIQGGSYNVDADGNDILQYPVYKDSTEDAFWNLIRSALLGKSSLTTAQDWVDSGFDSLGAKQTAVYQDMLVTGVNDRDAFALLQQIQNAQETAYKKKDAVQRDVLRDSKVSGEGKSVVYYGLMATEKERELMDSLADLGADSGAVINALMEMRDANALEGSAVMTAKYGAIKKAALTDEEKTVLVGSIMGTDLLTESGGLTQFAKFQYAVQNGMSVDQFIDYRNTGASIDDYLELRDAGASIEDAMETGIALEELKNSVEDPTTVQKWRVVIDSTDDVQTQLISLSIVMSDSQYRKVQTAYNFGVLPEVYVKVNEALPKYDIDGNGRYTQAEVTKAINEMSMLTSTKAALWQLVTGASSAKNNPYSTEIGQKVIDAINAAKEKESESGLTFEEEIRRQLMGLGG